VIPIASKSRPSRTLPPSTPELGRPLGRRFSLPSLKKLLYVGIAAGALVGAYLAYPLVFDVRSAPTPTPAAAAPRPAKPAATAGPAAKPGVPPAPLGVAERTAAVASAVAKGKRLTESGDFSAAVVAFNEAVTLDPANLDARAGLAAAGAQYRAQKADQDALKAIESEFKEGEYASGLRLAYRLPATIDAGRVERVKAAGWYNLAVIALRAGDTRGAVSNLEEALAIDANDAEAGKLKDFARRYADVPKDRAFLDTVEALPFRPFP
jgi:tetratricopeptide (TPR) repeat protein